MYVVFCFFLPILPIVPVGQEEIAEIKRKMKTMNNQVTRLRDEISGKELALAKDEQEHKRLDKDNEALKVLSSGLQYGYSSSFLSFSVLLFDQSIFRGDFRVVHVYRHFVLLQAELQLMKLQLEETKQRVDSQKAEQQNLQKIIADADAEHVQQKKQMEQVKKDKLWCREKNWEVSPPITGDNCFKG